MAGLSEFTFVGRVVSTKAFGKVTKVRVIANYPRKDEDGDWEDDPHAVTLTVFNDGKRKYIEKHIGVGDLILAKGRIKEDRYEKDGEMRYEHSLIVSTFSRLARKSEDDALI